MKAKDNSSIYGKTDLIEAIKDGNLSKTKEILDNISAYNIETIGENGLNALLAHEKNEVNIQDGEGKTPLMYICEKQRSTEWTNIAKILIDKGACSSITDNRGLSPLNIIAKEDIVSTHNLPQAQTLELAKLVVSKENINLIDEDGLPPLFVALKNGNFEFAELLIDEGASLFSENSGTIFHYIGSSYQFNHSDNEQRYLTSIVNIFQKAIKNYNNIPKLINQVHYNDMRPLDKAVRSDLNFELVKLLIKEGADPTKTNSHNKNSLHYALENHSSKNVSYLLQVSPNLKDSISQIDLLNLASENSPECFYKLLKAGVKNAEKAVKLQSQKKLLHLIKLASKEENLEMLFKITKNFEKKDSKDINKNCIQNSKEVKSILDNIPDFEIKQKFIDILSEVDFSKAISEPGFAQRNLHFPNKPENLSTDKKITPVNVDGQTPLMKILKDNPEGFISFIKNNSDIDFKETDATGSNILHHLAKFLIEEPNRYSLLFYHYLRVIFEKISESGVNIKDLLNQRNQDDLTPVDEAAYSIYNSDFIDISVENGFDLMQKNSSGKNVLHHALKNNYFDAAKYLPNVIKHLLNSEKGLIKSISEKDLSEFAQRISQGDSDRGEIMEIFYILLKNGVEKPETAVKSLNEMDFSELIAYTMRNYESDLLSRLIGFLGKEKISNELTFEGYAHICSALYDVNNPELQQQMLKILKNGGFKTIEADFTSSQSDHSSASQDNQQPAESIIYDSLQEKHKVDLGGLGTEDSDPLSVA